MRGEILDYTVQEGDTVGTIAEKFGVSEDTIRWQNDFTGDRRLTQSQKRRNRPFYRQKIRFIRPGHC